MKNLVALGACLVRSRRRHLRRAVRRIFRVDMRDPGCQWHLLAGAVGTEEISRAGLGNSWRVCGIPHHWRVGPALVDWLLALEGNQRGDRERPTSRKHVAEALCVLLRGSLCVFQPTNRVTDHACSSLRTVFRAAAFAAERETFAVALGEKTGGQHVARAASSIPGGAGHGRGGRRRRTAARWRRYAPSPPPCVRSTRHI